MGAGGGDNGSWRKVGGLVSGLVMNEGCPAVHTRGGLLTDAGWVEESGFLSGAGWWGGCSAQCDNPKSTSWVKAGERTHLQQSRAVQGLTTTEACQALAVRGRVGGGQGALVVQYPTNEGHPLFKGH